MRSRRALLVLVAFSAVGATCKNGETSAEKTALAKPAPKPKSPPEEPAAPAFGEIEGYDIAELPPSVRHDFLRIMNETFCYCGCPRTLAACLSNRTDCSCVECSDRMARFIRDEFMNGASTNEVELGILEGFAEGYNGARREFELADHGSLGPADAKFTLVEFADFRCGHCKAAYPVLHNLVARRKDTRLVFFYYPLGASDGPSMMAAEAVEEARKQGKFWQMSAIVYEHQHQIDRANLIKWGKQLGMDVATLNEALDDHRHRARVNADKAVGQKAQVQSTPTIFVNGRPFGLPRTMEHFQLRLAMEEERGSCR